MSENYPIGDIITMSKLYRLRYKVHHDPAFLIDKNTLVKLINTLDMATSCMTGFVLRPSNEKKNRNQIEEFFGAYTVLDEKQTKFQEAFLNLISQLK